MTLKCQSLQNTSLVIRVWLLFLLGSIGWQSVCGQGVYPDLMLHYDNGPLITNPGGGANGADVSAFQPGMITFGWSVNHTSGNRLADDFTVDAPAGWNLEAVTVYAYQTGSDTNSTITDLYLQIWDGRPDDLNSVIVYGDLVANRLEHTSWTGIYRTTHDQLQNTQRPIMACTALVDVHLPAGTYWLDWSIIGTLASGPWGPPISIPGETTTGNALQYIGTWGEVTDGGGNTPQGMPFKLWRPKADALPFCEDFSTWLPEDWNLHQLDAIEDNWLHLDSSAYHHDYVGNANSWLVTPPITLPDNPGLRLHFDEKNTYMEWYVYSGVLISNGSADPADGDFAELYESNAALPDWTRTQLSLDAYAGQTVHIAFNYRGDWAHRWWVDNVCVFALMADFSADPLTGDAPLDVQFTDDSSGEPDGRAWYFGDEKLDGAWQLVTSAADWAGRDKFAAAVLPDGDIVVAGGYVNVNPWRINDVWRSTDGGSSWMQMTASAEWTARFGHACVALPDGSLVVMGGYDTAFLNDVWRSTDKGASWTRMTDNAEWIPRGYFAAEALPDGSLVVMGGHTGYEMLNDVWRSTDNGATWTELTDAAPWQARTGHTSVLLSTGDLLLMGGYIPNHPWSVNDVWRSSDSGATWQQVTDAPGWSARANHQAVALPDDSIVMLGGNDGAFVNDVWRSTDGGANWTQVAEAAAWSSRMQFVAGVLKDGAILVMGGNVGTGMGRDVWRLQTAGSYEANPQHTYTGTGTYSVTLVVYDSFGTSVRQKTDYIAVETGDTYPVTLGAEMLFDPAEWLPENDWIYAVESSNPTVATAEITPEGQLLLKALSMGTSLITVTATNPQTQEQHSLAFWIAVVGYPDVTSNNFRPFEPWNPRFEQLFTVQNNSGYDAVGIRFLFSDLADGVTVANSTGTAPDGRVMVEWIAPFPDGATETLTVIYEATGDFRADHYPPSVEVQFIFSQLPGLPENLGPPIISDLRILPDGRKMLEFSSVPARTYMIEYSDTSPAGPWIPITTLTITAGANRTQWLDTGPPTIPDSITGMRFYRVREVLQ